MSSNLAKGVEKPVAHIPGSDRDFVFVPTEAVARSRDRTQYLNCAACQADNSEYLFHKVGVRFVRCRNCGIVYVNPVGSARSNYFEIERSGQYPSADDKELCLQGFAVFLERVASEF